MEREAIGLAGREYHRPELLLPVILVPEDQDVPDPELEVQLCGQAGGMQLKDPKLGGIFNMGGTAVANYVSILERIK